MDGVNRAYRQAIQAIQERKEMSDLYEEHCDNERSKEKLISELRALRAERDELKAACAHSQKRIESLEKEVNTISLENHGFQMEIDDLQFQNSLLKSANKMMGDEIYELKQKLEAAAILILEIKINYHATKHKGCGLCDAIAAYDKLSTPAVEDEAKHQEHIKIHNEAVSKCKKL